MNLILYHNKSEKNALHKNLETIRTFTDFRLLEGTSESRPIVTIQLDSPVVFDYVYIETFNSYYYKEDFVNIHGNIWKLVLTRDPLMSFQNDIEKIEGIVERQEFDYDPYLTDNLIPCLNDTFVVTKKLNNGSEFNTYNQVILINSGVAHT